MAKYTKSKLTKKYTRLAIIFTTLSLLLMFGPLGYYTVAGLLGGALVIQKVALISSVISAVFLSALCAWLRWNFKSKIWIFVLGLFFVVENFLPMIILFATTQIIDELIIAPLAKRFRAKASSCKDTDKQFAERGV